MEEQEARVLRWAVVGAGDVCRRKSGPALAGVEGSRIEVVYRRNGREAEGFVELMGQGRVVAGFDQVLEDPRVDGVYIATPHQVHAEQAIACLRAGKAVLVEKPMALNTQECTQMVLEAERAAGLGSGQGAGKGGAGRRATGQGVAGLSSGQGAGGLLGVAYYRRGYPSIQKVRAILASGLIGEPVSMALNNEFPTSHRIDLVHYLLGSVGRVGITRGGTGSFAPENMQPMITLETLGGVRVSLASGWLETGMAEALVIHGTLGSIVVEDLKGGVLRVQTPKEQIQLKVPGLPWTHWGLIENFVQVWRDRVGEGSGGVASGQGEVDNGGLAGGVNSGSGDGSGRVEDAASGQGKVDRGPGVPTRPQLLCSGEEGRKSTVILDFLALAEPGGDWVQVEYPD